MRSCYSFSSVQFSCSVVSDSLRHHKPQHARPPCPSPTPGVHPNPCPLSRWCHPTISSSVLPFSSCPQSFLASGSFQMSQLFTSGGQSIGVSASTSVLPMNTQDWSPLGDWFDLLAIQGTLKSLLQHHSSKATSCKMPAWMKHKLESRLLAESKEELKSLLMRVKEESEKARLKFSIQKTEIMASSPITSWQIDGRTMKTVKDFIFLGSKITADDDCSHKIKRCLLLERKAMTKLDRVKKQRHHFVD